MASTTTFIPPVLWAQRKDKLFLTIDVQDVKAPKIELTETGLRFSGSAQGKEYNLDITFFKEIDVGESKYAVLPRHIVFNIAKKESGPHWDRLLKDAGKQWWLKADWSRWVEEDDEDEEEGAPGDFDMSALGGMGGMGGMGMGGMGMGGMGGMGGMDFSNFAGGDDDDDEDDEDDVPPLEEEGEDEKDQ